MKKREVHLITFFIKVDCKQANLRMYMEDIIYRLFMYT
jgi:hypothetical protein